DFAAVDALGRREDDVGGVAGPGRKAGLEQVEGGDGVGVAPAEVVAVGAADRPAQTVQDNEAGDPHEHDEATAAVAPARQFGESHEVSFGSRERTMRRGASREAMGGRPNSSWNTASRQPPMSRRASAAQSVSEPSRPRAFPPW